MNVYEDGQMTPEEIAKLPYRKNVGIMLANADGKVWVGQRLDAMRLGTGETAWQMPQGGIDKGEDPLEAARRELWEETGITSVSLLARAPRLIRYDLPEELVGTALKGKYRGQEMAWFAFRFTGAGCAAPRA